MAEHLQSDTAQRGNHMSIAPGWYFARMKTWNVDGGLAVVKVTQLAPHAPVQVWQCGDHRPWPVDAWDWGRRIFPDVENYT